MKITRENCVVCNSSDLEVFLSYTMPVYSSDVESLEGHKYSDIKFSECKNCNAVQLKEFVDPEIVYQFNHNREIVGETWEKHYDEFRDFIHEVVDKTILEISDPVAKLARKFEDYKKWYIVEPHSSGNIIEKNIFFIDRFFDESFEIEDRIDIVVHSHFFEHTFNPLDFLKKCNQLLGDGGIMYISTPNLQDILYNKNNPNSVLHFEHTFYFDVEILSYLFNESGFVIEKIKEFKKHSLFLKLRKMDNYKKIHPLFKRSSTLFVESYKKHQDLIDEINSKEGKFILFGCHISSQFLIYNGLDSSKIEFIIDNSTTKQGKFLYGTKILTKSPLDILNDDYTVIYSHMGVYAEEIKKGLIEIKKDIKLI